MLACKLSWEVLGKDLARRGPYIQTVKDLHLARRGSYLAVVNLQTVWGVLKIHFELFWTFIQYEVDTRKLVGINYGASDFGPPS